MSAVALQTNDTPTANTHMTCFLIALSFTELPVLSVIEKTV